MKFKRLKLKRKEIWKGIPDFDGYEISNYGKIKSYKIRLKGVGNWEINYNKTPRILKFTKHYKGYLMVQLSQNGKQKRFMVHKLIALTFLGLPPKGKTQIRHLDDNKINNCVSNLKWGNGKENFKDRLKNNINGKKLTNDDVSFIKTELKNYKHGMLKKLSKKFKVSLGAIHNIKTNRNWKNLVIE